jgi:hypothetical protein
MRYRFVLDHMSIVRELLRINQTLPMALDSKSRKRCLLEASVPQKVRGSLNSCDKEPISEIEMRT